MERGGKEQDTANRKLGGDQYTSYRCVTLSEIQYIRFLKKLHTFSVLHHWKFNAFRF